MNDTLYIDDLDGAVTLFKSTEEGTETIAVFDEEHREVIQDLLAEVKRSRRLRKQLEDCKRQIQFTADWIRDRGEDTCANVLDEFLEMIE